jgi:predicted transcriptional regulator
MKYNKYDNAFKKDIEKKLIKYINETEIPIIAEFAYQNNIPRSSLYDFENISELLKKTISKKEAQLEKLALTGNINTTMAIFSLKQIGWRDKHEIEGSGEITLNIIKKVVDGKDS